MSTEDYLNLRIGGRCERHLSPRPCNECAAETDRRPLDIDGLRDMLHALAKPTTQYGLSKTLGVSPQYLSDVMLGRRAPGPKLLKALGLREEIRYLREGTS